MSSSTALTINQQSAVRVSPNRPDLETPANDPFSGRSHRRLKSERESEEAEGTRYQSKYVDEGVSSRRKRRASDYEDQTPRRRHSDYRQSSRNTATMLLAHSGFVAQFIAQEIIPDGAHRPHNAKNLGGFLYEATIGSGLNPGHNPALNLQA